MKLDRYELKAGRKLTTFEFVSEGVNGRIGKVVQFTPTNYKDLFNLAFGDKDGETGVLNDMAISNNGDSEKVLATVVATVYAFTDKYPDAWVYASGSTKVWTRLYRIGISKYLNEVKKDFDVYGQVSGEWQRFEKDVDYQAFLVKKKLRNFDI